MALFQFSRQMGTRIFPPFFHAPCVCCSFVILIFFLNFLISVTKIKSKILYARAQAAILRSLGLNFLTRRYVAWTIASGQKESASKTNLPSSGQASVLTSCVRKSLEKAKYRWNNSTRKNVKNLLQQKSIEVSSITVWRYMTREKWKENTFIERTTKEFESPFEIRQERREVDSRRLGQFFIYTEVSVLNIFSSTLIQKRISYRARTNVMSGDVPPAFQVSEAKCEGDGVGWHDGWWAHKFTRATHRPNLHFWVLHQPNSCERSKKNR